MIHIKISDQNAYQYFLYILYIFIYIIYTLKNYRTIHSIFHTTHKHQFTKNFGKYNFNLLYIPKYVSLHYKKHSNSYYLTTHNMKIQKPRAIDVFQEFTLLSDLSYSQNVVFNYAKQTWDKAQTISKSMNFIARSAAQSAYKALEEKYQILTTNKTWQITINYLFAPTLINYRVKNWTWRPKSIKDSQINIQPTTTTDATHWQLQSPNTQET